MLLRRPRPCIDSRLTAPQASLGAAIGGAVAHTRSLEFIPSLALGYTIARVSYKGDYFGTPMDESAPSNYGSLTLTAGLVLNRKVSLAPNLSFLIGVPGATGSYGIAIGYSFHR